MTKEESTKLFVLWWEGNYEEGYEGTVWGVFSSRQAARKFIPTCEGFNGCSTFAFRITEFELDMGLKEGAR